MITDFLKKYPLEELDERRQIVDEDKIAAFEKHNICESCGYRFKDYKEAEYHHKVRHVDGGKSELNNIMVLCQKCHDRIHGKEKIELPNGDDIAENGEE